MQRIPMNAEQKRQFMDMDVLDKVGLSWLFAQIAYRCDVCA